MRLIRGLHNLTPADRGTVATIGNFDGVHRGHQAMLDLLRQEAHVRDTAMSVISFEPDPREYLAPEQAPARITSLRDKVLRLADLGVDRFLCLPFNDALAGMEPEQFIRRILVDGLAVQYLVVGDDFRFGHRRKGDYDTLVRAGGRYGFTVTQTETIHDGRQRISSTRIREALARSDLGEAGRLLGYPYAISGRVVHGDRIGRDLGFPTANIRFHWKPALEGIFAVDASIEGGIPRPAIASVGTRPTVNGRQPLLEVYLLEFSGDLYHRHLQVTFRHWIRGQTRFGDLDALRAQIDRDVAEARKWFASGRGPRPPQA